MLLKLAKQKLLSYLKKKHIHSLLFIFKIPGLAKLYLFKN